MAKTIVLKSLHWLQNHLPDEGTEFIALIAHLDFPNSSDDLTMRYSIYEPYEPNDENGFFILSLEFNSERLSIGEYTDFSAADREATRHYEMLMTSMSSAK